MVKRFLYATIISALMLGSDAQALEVNVYPDANSGSSFVFVQGVIQLGDEAKVLQSISGLTKAIVVLSSPGGSPIAAMEIGKAIRLKGLTTVVPDGALCVSACALIWLSGSPRFIGSTGQLGFHAAYIEKDGHLLESGVGNALIGRYLTLLNLPEAAVVFVTNAPPQGMNWLRADSAGRHSIDFRRLADGVPQKKPTSSDPIAVVASFYDALRSGDGSQASALVVPEKRGVGPFSEPNITSYFSRLPQKLQVRQIKRDAPDRFSVDYEYGRADGFKCVTSATVTTVFVYGQHLVQRIAAKC